MRRFIIISIICIFGVAPAAAYAAVLATQPANNTPSEEVTPATQSELLDIIQKGNASLPEDQQFGNILGVTSFKRMDTWWYVVMVKVNERELDEELNEPILVAKFNNTPDGSRVITSPGDDLSRHNISGGLGVPYDVIDELNKELGE